MIAARTRTDLAKSRAASPASAPSLSGEREAGAGARGTTMGEWRYAQGDVVRLADGGVWAIIVRERVHERGGTVPAYEAREVRGRRAHGTVRLIRDAGIVGRFDPRDDAEAD